MTSSCKGCGEELTSIRTGLSRYRHGELCSECCVIEAFEGDFIKRYGGQFQLMYPAEMVKHDSHNPDKPTKAK